MIKNIFKKKKEIIISSGYEYLDKKFYVVGISYKMAGLFAIIKSNLSHISYALDKGYIPVIDMINHQNQFLNEENKNNPWEYFFEQPNNYNLKDIQYSKHIILSEKSQRPSKKYTINMKLLDSNKKAKLNHYSEIYKKYIRVNNKIQLKLDYDYKHLIENKFVLGVLCRGTDYLLKKPKNHPIQPDPILVINKTKELLQKNKYTHIYLATEDQDIYSMFKKEFGDKLLTNNQKRFSKNDFQNVEFISQIEHNTIQEKYEISLEYLSAINILSKCNAFIGGKTSGTLGVYLMSEGFEYEYIWNLGTYK